MHNLLNKSSNRNGYRLEEIGKKILTYKINRKKVIIIIISTYLIFVNNN